MEQDTRSYSSSTAQQGGGAVDPSQNPVIPLPNPGEGGPVYPGNMDTGVTDPNQIPVIPLPNPGEGEPAYPGDMDTGVTDPGQIPVIPLPNPGEGGPVYPGNGGSSNFPFLPGGGGCSSGVCGNVTIPPGVIGAGRPGSSKTRFLNAAYGYQAFRILVGSAQVASLLNYATVTGYGRVGAGYQTVTVAGADGYIYIQKTMPFQAGAVTTIAVINTPSGIDLLQIIDSCCPPTNGFSSFRVGNLAINTTPLDVIMSDGRVVYRDLRYKEVASFKRIRPGAYQFFYADTDLPPMPASLDIETLDSAWLGVYPPHETFGSVYLDVVSNTIYTVYLLQSGSGRNNIQNLILMDR